MEKEKTTLTKTDINNLTLEINSKDDKGFTLWCIENIKVNGKKRKIKHWIIDASCLSTDGEIRLGGLVPGYKLTAKYNQKNNSIKLIRKK